MSGNPTIPEENLEKIQ